MKALTAALLFLLFAIPAFSQVVAIRLDSSGALSSIRINGFELDQYITPQQVISALGRPSKSTVDSGTFISPGECFRHIRRFNNRNYIFRRQGFVLQWDQDSGCMNSMTLYFQPRFPHRNEPRFKGLLIINNDTLCAEEQLSHFYTAGGKGLQTLISGPLTYILSNRPGSEFSVCFDRQGRIRSLGAGWPVPKQVEYYFGETPR